MLEGLRAGQILLADRAYDSNALRDAMTARGAWANVKPISRRIDPPTFSPFLYRYRNLVERFFNKLKRYRAIATRYRNAPPTTSRSSSSQPFASGCDIMSR